MPESTQGSVTQGKQGDQVKVDADKARLLAQVEKTISDVEETVKSLLERYPKDGLLDLMRKFEQISTQYTNYADERESGFQEVIRRSRDRQAFVTNVAAEAAKVAQLFEKFSKSPNAYSASKSRIQINKLQAQLKNLRLTCQAGSLPS